MNLTSFGETQPSLAWDFNGTTAPYIGSATGTTSGSVSYSTGKYIQAVNIVNTPTGTPNTGTNYITWTNYGTFNPSVGVTVCFWINVNALPASGQQSIPLWMRGSAVNSAVFITLRPTYWGAAYTDGTNYYVPTSSAPLSTGVWYHLTVVVGAGTVVGYQNGVQIASPVAFSNPLDVSGFLYLGGNGNYAPASAIYDDLRVYNSALSSSQIQSIYQAQGMPSRALAVTSADLLFYAPFNGTTTDSISSVVPTLTGSVSYDSVNAKYTQSLIVTNTPGANATNYLEYPKTIDIAVTGLTCAFWVRTGTDVSTYQSILSFRGVAQYQGQIRYELATTKIIMSYWNGKSGGGQASASAYQVGPVLSTNTWYHLAIAIKPNGNISFYVNAVEYAAGQNCGLRDIFPTGSRVDSFFVGTSAINPNYQNAFSGEFDDLRLYRYALETPAIVSLYNTVSPANFNPPSTSMSGAPLFNQLSQSAASSAVGAFSLRAVNGVTAKAVQVRAVPSGASSPSVFSIIGNQFSAPDQSPTPPDTSVSGQTSYNGTNQYTRINPLALTPGTTGLTISMAFKLNSRNNTLFKLNAPYPSLTIEFASTSSNISVIEYLPAAGTQVWFCNVAYTTSTNVYISLVISGTTAKTFVNNTLFNTSTLRSAMSNATNYDLYGVGSWNGGGYANMTLYDLRIQNTIIPDSSFAAQDFYADERGNLLTAPVIGTHLKNWLGSATGYVTKWYDQSGRGNDAIQDTAAKQPIIQRATKGPGYMCIYSGTQGLNFGAYDLLNNKNYTTCGVVRRTAVPAGTNYYLCGDGGVNNTDQKFHSGYRTSTLLTLAHYSDDTDLTVPSFLTSSTEPTAYNYLMLGTGLSGRMYSYSSGTLYSTPRTYNGYLNHAVGTSFSIGGGFGTFIGEIYELLVFTQSLYDLDGTTSITQIYQNQLSAYGT
jgi:hypothetical protein